MSRLFAALLALFSAIGLAAAPAEAQIRITGNPIVWSTEVRSCDFEALVRELRIVVEEYPDERGIYYSFSTKFPAHSSDLLIELGPCPLWSAEKHTGKVGGETAVVAYSSLKLTLAYLADFPLEVGMRGGYVQVLKRSVEVRLEQGWWLDAQKQAELWERLYQTMGPVTLKGRLTVDHERCGEGFDMPRSVEQLCKLVLRVYPSELNGIKTGDPLAEPYIYRQ